MRYFLDIAYKGTNYHGWQIQPNAHTIQAEIEAALSKIYREDIRIVGSGRTDTGVHAIQQVAHFDGPTSFITEQLVNRLNSILPADVVVKAAQQVKADAHARFDAIERGYIYKISMKRSPFGENEFLHVPYELNIDLMNEAAQTLLGVHDFQSFSRVKTEVNHFICDIREAKWERNDEELVFHVQADRFLRGMIRALVGTMIDIGRGKLSVADFVAIQEAKNRQRAGKAASPDGLFLNKVEYPSEIYI